MLFYRFRSHHHSAILSDCCRLKVFIMDSVIVDSDSLFSVPCHWVLVASLKDTDVDSKKVYLSESELTRCESFRRVKDQQRYILAHALKRYCLSRYLHVSPLSLQFSDGAKGKPYCTHKNAPAFNLSHSGEFVLLGLSTIGYVGVDVEQIDRDISPNIFPRVLSAEQHKQVMNSPAPHYEFMCYWTQKEAISKTLGLGLSIDFATVECSGVEGEFDTHHSKQHLLVSTRQWDQNHIISVASTANTALQMLTLKSWGDDVVIENKNFQTASTA